MTCIADTLPTERPLADRQAERIGKLEAAIILSLGRLGELATGHSWASASARHCPGGCLTCEGERERVA